MKQRLEQWLLRTWYGAGAPLWLRPLEALFRVVVYLRRAAYGRLLAVATVGVPVIVVGNISVGGTGKTPLVLWIVRRLQQRGLAPGIVTRGYAGAAREGARLVTQDDEAAQVGDEPLVLARRAGVPVAVGRDRVSAARLLVEAGVQVIVSDDGLQHYRLARDLEIAVLDGERGLGNGACLPAGPLREPRSRLASVDLVVINGGAGVHWPGGVTMALVPEALRQVAGDGPVRTLQSFRGQQVHAVAGIGNPDRFFGMLAREGMKVISHPMSDHARIIPGDLDFGDGLPVLMTEKDAVKCGSFANPQTWYVPVTAMLDPAGCGRFDKLLDGMLARH